MTDTEQTIITMLSSAGTSKSLAFQALAKVKTRDFAAARELLAQSKQADLEAHAIQTALIGDELRAQGESSAMSLLMVHAQDHYMTAQLARDLVEELIDVFESLGETEK